MQYSLKAAVVFPITAPPIRDGVVTVEDGRILSVGPADGDESREPNGLGDDEGGVGRAAKTRVIDLGNVALLPGLINAHTHLELSDCSEPLGRSGERLADWIPRVIGYRRARADAAKAATEVVADLAVRRGLEESAANGVAAVGDIVQPAGPGEPYGGSSLGGVRFLELLAPAAERVQHAIDAAREFLDPDGGPLVAGRASSAEAGLPAWRPGLSPHAPYSVRSELLDTVVRLSFERRVPVAMHLAESAEEIELLRTGGGPLRALLEQLGAWQPGLIRTPSRPMDYLRRLAHADRALIVHGNYLDDDEIAFLAAHRERMSVVFCPRTHARFNHRPYPLGKMLTAGVNVCLGTDSRATSPDLSLWAEMAAAVVRLAEQDSGSPCDRPAEASSAEAPWRKGDWGKTDLAEADRHPAAVALRMATLNGARALGLEDEFGRIAPGCRAELIAVELPGPPEAGLPVDPHDLAIFRSASTTIRRIPRDAMTC